MESESQSDFRAVEDKPGGLPPPKAEPGRSKISLTRLHTKVPNTGSTARDHLANERTYLAWLRTGLSLLGLGLAFARFAGGWTGMLTGGLFVFLGVVFIGYSGWRYFEVRSDLLDERFLINTGGVLIMLVLTGMVALGCTLVMIVLLFEESRKGALSNPN
jgi:putative membrane protein